MSIVQTIVGGGFVLVFLSGITQAIAPDPSFMTVHRLSYSDGQIKTDRTTRDPPTIADWRVTVVGEHEEAPTCSTQPGPKIHEGWSRYEVGSKASEMHLDVWVGDPGCYDRLSAGVLEMFVTWTPRDGRDPVSEYLKFSK